MESVLIVNTYIHTYNYDEKRIGSPNKVEKGVGFKVGRQLPPAPTVLVSLVMRDQLLISRLQNWLRRNYSGTGSFIRTFD